MEGVSVIFIFVGYIAIRLMLGHHRTPTMRDKKRYQKLIDLLKNKDYTTVLQNLEGILSQNPQSAFCWALKAECHLALREYHQTILYADKALNIDYNLPETYYHKALACLHLGNTAGAMEELNKTIWYSREQHAEAFYHKGLLLYEAEDFDKALYAFEKATQLEHEQANYELLRLRNGVVNTKKSKK
ncbi:MAG: hypothetical protein EAZ95_04205 [Bacteroidetes bacterium]|nr:MAG: hypothetical protein EAZ95_04205 [Bacteroidota bacterium]